MPITTYISASKVCTNFDSHFWCGTIILKSLGQASIVIARFERFSSTSWVMSTVEKQKSPVVLFGHFELLKWAVTLKSSFEAIAYDTHELGRIQISIERCFC